MIDNTDELLDFVNDYREFEAWLGSKEDGDTVGIANSIQGCPLGNWIKERTGHLPVICLRNAEIASLGIVYQLPTWAVNFYHYVDNGPYSEQVSAREAKLMLAAVPKGES
jgi:hypothetical protein